MRRKTSFKSLFFISIELTLAFIFAYTGFTKITNFSEWKLQYTNLDIVIDFGLEWTVYILPFIEIITSFLFIIEKMKKIAAWSSLILMSAFTIYLIYKIYIWEESLCPCGGIFSQLTLDKHLIVNFILLLLSIILIFPKKYVNE